MKLVSKSKGWNLVRWITRDDNVRAKSLYDRVSEKTNWDVYELKWKVYQVGKLGEVILTIEEKEKEKIREISKALRETKKNSIGAITGRIRTYYINTD